MLIRVPQPWRPLATRIHRDCGRRHAGAIRKGRVPIDVSNRPSLPALGASKPQQLRNGQSTLAPDWNQRPIKARSSSVMPVALFMGICLVTTTCW